MDKIKELINFIEDRQKKQQNSPDKNCSKDYADFCINLLKRTPEEFLLQTDVHTLADISDISFQILQGFLAKKEDFSLNLSFKEGEESSIINVMEDRPFIVDTITEIFSKLQVKYSVLLHPIIKIGEKHISLIYIAIKSVEKETFEKLHSNLKNSLSSLIKITNDHQQMLAQLEKAKTHIQNSASNSKAVEVGKFLHWLSDGGYIFIGCQEFDSKFQKKLGCGIFSSPYDKLEQLSDLLVDEVKHFESLSKSDKEVFFNFSSLPIFSPIHKFSFLCSITLKTHNDSSSGFISFVGLFTSKIQSQEILSIPIIRGKIHHILEQEGYIPNSHGYKEILAIAQLFPRSELIELAEADLHKFINLILHIQRRNEVKVYLRYDNINKILSILIAAPKDRLSTSTNKKIQELLVESFPILAKGDVDISYHFSDYPLALANFMYHAEFDNSYTNGQTILTEKALELKDKIEKISRTWDDKLLDALLSKYGHQKALDYYNRYLKLFTQNYKASIEVEQCLKDIEHLELLSEANPLETLIQRLELSQNHLQNSHKSYSLRMYMKNMKFSLSTILPILENAGLGVVSEEIYNFRGQESFLIYDFEVYPSISETSELDKDLNFGNALKDLLVGSQISDRLNALLIDPGFSSRQISFFRAIFHYLWQLKAFSSGEAIYEAFTKNPQITELLYSIFDCKFNPVLFSNDPASRRDKVEEKREEILKQIKTVKSLLDDKILKATLEIITCTVRTNFFQKNSTSIISLKVQTELLGIAPEPKQKFEIFISGKDFKGTHLRASKVARGGIRWSEREDDFRTEVLGLVKTQKIKNAIIVPSGAKGAFILHSKPTKRDELLKQVEFIYKKYIRSLLELTDNLVNEKVVHPADTVIYDGEDPYFVVAADKGTATFSDTANGLSKEFGLWIEDAFASGGSNGYDHKKYGITARGGWAMVEDHFKSMGTDILTQEFTVVGIGDMSGDVFGNAMLLNRNIKLIAAFNHKHIFIDPYPTCEKSFSERKRLFETPNSQWSDYNSSLISPGGGVFDRDNKEIKITHAVQQVLGTTKEVLSGNELIQIILKSPVDLLWNGGIGTYFKSATEDNIMVGDRQNDEVRINSKDIRAKIVGEGGNLGFTQLARIEYAKKGGLINTDAIDNAGGVNLSDHEVNIKLLLQIPVKKGEITLEQRNVILQDCAHEVCKSVIDRNISQNKVITFCTSHSRHNLEHYQNLLKKLESEGFILSREQDCLPSDEDFERRISLRVGLTRPEISVLLSYARMAITESIVKSNLPEKQNLQSFLSAYFPKQISEKFGKYLSQHPLKREIIATEVANALIERIGITLALRYAEEFGLSVDKIVEVFLGVEVVMEAEKLSSAIENSRTKISKASYEQISSLVYESITSMIRWICSNNVELDSEKIIEKFKIHFRLLRDNLEKFYPPIELKSYQENLGYYSAQGLEQDISKQLASIGATSTLLEMIKISQDVNFELLSIAKLYMYVAEKLNVEQLRKISNQIVPQDSWEKVLLSNSKRKINYIVTRITRAIIQKRNSVQLSDMEEFFAEQEEILSQYFNSVLVFANKPITTVALHVILEKLSRIYYSPQP